MSLQVTAESGIPVETVRVARAALPDGCPAMRMRDLLGPLFTDAEFVGVFSRRGRPALSPAMLALVSVLQFTEGLTDRQAAHAVRTRIDWKYALGLPLEDGGFDFSALSEFRARVISGGLEQRMLDALLDKARDAGLLKTGGRARTDSTHVLAATKDLNQSEFVHETLRAALNALALVDPAWLQAVAPADWYARYSKRFEESVCARWGSGFVHIDQIGADGLALLRAVTAPDAPAYLRAVPAVEIMRRIWVQQFTTGTGEDGLEATRRRTEKDRPAASIRITSPYDPQARTGAKRETAWDGYKVHLTEACEPDAPHLITNVVTTTAPVADMHMAATVHESLSARGLLPTVHLVDAGYVDAEQINHARHAHKVELLGPIPAATTWQGVRDDALDASQFVIDWHERRATCPAGQVSTVWRDTTSHRGTPVSRVRFPARCCQPCPLRERCTSSTTSGRNLTLRPREEHETLTRLRKEQATPEWRRAYQHRSGIEGTIAQAVGAYGARRSRYRGLAKTTLQHLLTATAINLSRLDAWITEQPLAPTRASHFAKLRPAG